MIEELSAMLRLKENLRDAVVRLANEAENNPDDRVALEYLRLVTKCQELEREIDIATKEVLDCAATKGTA
jgi:hypothetical protein